jgi:molybdopterin-guanine dinucleotide biosynthesis protein A
MARYETENAGNHAGFVLVGGASTRMGSDKARLVYRDSVLAEFVARQVEAVTGSAVLVGPPERYGDLGRRVIADLRPGNGPLGGIETALSATKAEWNLIVACDMPRVGPELFREILRRAANTTADCVVPISAGGEPEPLCAAWRASCLGAVSKALEAGRRKTQDVYGALRVEYWKPLKTHWFENMNTPEDWTRHKAAVGGETRVDR